MISKDRKNLARTLVGLASNYLLKNFHKVKTGSAKSDGTLVSVVDRAVEKLILSRIAAAFPKDGILSEESQPTSGENDYVWIVDPLDGTHNFLAGLPLFGTLLALAKNEDVIFAACAFPLLNEFFIAERGKGAHCNGKRIHVSKSAQLKGDLFLSDGTYNTRAQIMRDVDRMTKSRLRLRILGTTPLSMTRVACGAAICATNRAGTPWDIAAPALIVEEAGGRVTEPNGKRWSVHSKELVATNGIVHRQVLEILKVNPKSETRNPK